MKQEIIIGVSVAIVVSVIVGVKTFLHKLMKFKMDESAIVRFFEGSSDDYTFRSTEAICAGTDIPMGRITVVCLKSKLIKRNAKKKESWCLK